MKRILIGLVMAVFLIGGTAYADINLETPKEISKDAVKVKVHSFTVTPNYITVELKWYAADGSVVKQEMIPIENVDFLGINTQPLYSVIQKNIKRMLGLKGTED